MKFLMEQEEMERVAQLLADGTDSKLIEILVSKNANADTMTKAVTMFNDGLCYDNLLVYINNPSNEFYEMYMRFHCKEIENILFLAEGRDKYNSKQLDQIEKMLDEHQMTKEEIRFFANPNFNENIMKNLRKAYKNGLNLDTAKRIFLDNAPIIDYTVSYKELSSPEITPANIDRTEENVVTSISFDYKNTCL